MAISGPITVTTVSGTGTETPDADYEVGYLVSVKLVYHGSAPGTLDLTISETEGLQKQLLNIVGNTDAVLQPRNPTHSSVDGAATGSYDPIQFSGPLQFDVSAGGDLAPAVTIYLEYLDNRNIV